MRTTGKGRSKRFYIGMLRSSFNSIELYFMVITRGLKVKDCMLQGHCTEGPKAYLFIRPKAGFAHGSFKNSFQATFEYLKLPTCLWGVSAVERRFEVTSYLKQCPCKLVIAKMGSAITYDSTRGTESGEERFKKLANSLGVVGRERFAFSPILQISRPPEYCIGSLVKTGNGHMKIDAATTSKISPNLDGILRHFIMLRNLSLTQTVYIGLVDQSSWASL
ncbi:hypothetical protein Tco_0434402 [Tanacetum coccineum]